MKNILCEQMMLRALLTSYSIWSRASGTSSPPIMDSALHQRMTVLVVKALKLVLELS